MSQAYSDPSRENDPRALPDIEVWHQSASQAAYSARAQENGADADFAGPTQEGWYWWACFPGCLPDGEPIGPFTTEAEALADAQDNGE